MKQIRNSDTLVSYNLKKDRGSYISFGIIILLTAFMLNLAFVLAFQVDKAYDEKFDDLNTADINFCISKSQDREELAEEIGNIEGVKEIECRNAVMTEAVVLDFRGADFSMNTIFYNMDETRNLNQLEVKEQSEKQSIYVPLYVSSFGQFEAGEEIIYQINGKDWNFEIAGVVEEMQYGNYGKGIMGAYLPAELYEKLAEGEAQSQVMEYSILTEEHADQKEVLKEIKKWLNENDITMLSGINSEDAKQTRTMVCNLLIIILMAFAFVILFVSVFLSKFRIQNSIEEDMINMGVLKACGYTGNEIIGTMVIPYVIVSGIAIIAGVVLSYCVLPILSEVLALQSGFSFTLSFDITALVLNIVILLGIIILFTYRAARRIRKIQPIKAIRGEGEDECKTTSMKQNILLFLVSFSLMILMAFAGTLFYNVIIKPDNFMKTLSEEIPQVIITPEAEYAEDLMEDLKDDDRVKQVLKYMTEPVEFAEGSITAFVCEDFAEVTNDLCYEGRNPKNQNEVALGSAYDAQYKIGDKIEIRKGEQTEIYEIVGFVQSVNLQGEICELTLDGYARINDENVNASFYIYLNEGESVSRFLKEYQDDKADMIKKSVNQQKTNEKSQETFSGLVTIIIAVIFVLTILIILFILYIVMKALITKRKKELGIYKAIGYSNWQLIIKITGNILPASILAILSSALLALIYMPVMNQLIFSMVGAMKNSLEVSVIWLLLFAFVQIAVNIIISICLARPIRKISVCSLIKE